MRTSPTTLLSILVLGAFVATSTAVAQNSSETNIWYFGNRAALDFNIPPGTPTAPSEITTSAMNAFEGSAMVCDRTTGAIRFYTNGIDVFNSSNVIMPNGNSIGGQSSTTQAALIVPIESNPDGYYIFTPRAEGSGGVVFSQVDMSLNGGLGDVVAKNQPLPTVGGTAPPALACEKVAAIRDAARAGYWVLFHQFGTNAFFAYHITNAGAFDNVVVSSVGTAITGSSNSRGEMKFSPDGQWLATANESLVSELFRFNNTSGVVALHATLDNGQQHYGLSFSPNSQILYINTGWTLQAPATSFLVIQYNLANQAPAAILASRTVVGTSATSSSQGLSAMQIAPDGRIYIARFNSAQIAAINCPNIVGTGCGYTDNGFTLTGGRLNTFGLPNLILEAVATPQFAGRDTAVCTGNTASIGIPTRAGHTYSWDPATGLTDPASATTNASPSATTTYILTVTNPFGCIERDTVTVTVNPLPSISVTGDSVICAGDPTDLSVTTQAGDQVTWSPATGLNTTTGPTVTANPPATTTYTVSITNATICTSTREVTVTVNPVPPLSVANRTPAICAGDSVRLSASSTATGATFLWSPVTGLDNPASPTPMASPAATTTYTVTVTDLNGCDSSTTVDVTVNPRPAAVVSRDTAICAGESFQLQASGGTIFRWSPGSGLSDSNAQNPVATPLATTTYQVIVVNSSNCADTATMTLTVNPLPVVTVSAADSAICRGKSTLLTATGGGTVLWSPVTGLSDPTSATPTASPLVTTTYTATVTNSFGCDTTGSVTIAVDDPPARFRLPDTLVGPNQRGVRLPITRIVNPRPPLCTPDTLVMEISFNATLFFPTRVTFGTIARSQVVGGRRILTIVFNGAFPPDTGNVLTHLVGDALLGDAVTTDLTFDSVDWDGLDVTTLSQNGALRTDSICSFFGNRLLNYRSGAAITKITPNPTSRGALAEIQIAGREKVRLELYSVDGTRLFDRGWTPQGEDEEDLEVVEIALPDDLPSGLYYLVLHSASMRDSKQLIIIR